MYCNLPSEVTERFVWIFIFTLLARHVKLQLLKPRMKHFGASGARSHGKWPTGGVALGTPA